VFEVDRGFVIEGKAHGHESAERGHPLIPERPPLAKNPVIIWEIDE
jgi:hypothetical protein